MMPLKQIITLKESATTDDNTFDITAATQK